MLQIYRTCHIMSTYTYVPFEGNKVVADSKDIIRCLSIANKLIRLENHIKKSGDSCLCIHGYMVYRNH